MNKTQTGTTVIFAILAALMAATREYHFGTTMHLPDASLAVFMLAGYYLPGWAFPVLLVEAGLVDYLALHYGGISGWSFSLAYGFMIPTYCVLWFAGWAGATRNLAAWRGLGEVTGIACTAIAAAFLVSNAGIYLFTDDSATLGVQQYAARVAPYFLPYIHSAFLYLFAAAVLHGAIALASRRTAQQA